jgi:exodeoxyribonuclease VII small subunit
MTKADKKLSFEDALKELETIVEKLERGEVSLDDAVKAYERGSELKQHCQDRLNEARLRVDKIRAAKGSSDAEGAEPFDAE